MDNNNNDFENFSDIPSEKNSVENAENVEDTTQENVEDTAQENVEDTTQENVEDTAEISLEGEQNVPTEPENIANKPKKSFKILSAIYDYAEIFAISIVAVLLLFTFGVRLCRVDGSSMNQTLNHNEMIIASNFFYTPKQGDIIVFHLSNDHYNEPLVKRVIATEGQTVELNLTTGVLKVDGEVYADEHAYISGGKYDLDIRYNKNYMYQANGNTYFVAKVPEGKLFVMGDNRNGSSDSRTSRVGFVDVDTVLGKAVLRISPFTILD